MTDCFWTRHGLDLPACCCSDSNRWAHLLARDVHLAMRSKHHALSSGICREWLGALWATYEEWQTQAVREQTRF